MGAAPRKKSSARGVNAIGSGKRAEIEKRTFVADENRAWAEEGDSGEAAECCNGGPAGG